MREEVFWIGRLLFSLVLLGSGFGHLTQTEASAQYAEYKRVPNPRLMVQITGVCMVLGGLAVVLGFWMDLAGLLIAVLVVIYAVKMHAFWAETDPQTQNVERAQFMKNISIAGGGLMLAALGPLDWYTITDGVF